MRTDFLLEHLKLGLVLLVQLRDLLGVRSICVTELLQCVELRTCRYLSAPIRKGPQGHSALGHSELTLPALWPVAGGEGECGRDICLGVSISVGGSRKEWEGIGASCGSSESVSV